MRPKIIWRRAARSDLLEILAYVAQENPGAAIKLIEDIEEKVDALKNYPKRYKNGRLPGTREMTVRKNYVVHYKVHDLEITILRIIHAARLWP